MPSCSTNNANLEKTNFDMFYKIDMLLCTEISLVIYIFSILRNLESNPGFLLRNSIKLLTQNLEEEKKSNFDMFYKYDCWAVICYPICMTNMSYERGIIVYTIIPDISFVILLFVFRDLKLNLGFLFFFFFLLHTVLLSSRGWQVSFSIFADSQWARMQPKCAKINLPVFLTY